MADTEDDVMDAEFIELEDDAPKDVIDTPDGGAIVMLGEDAPGQSDFYSNMAEELPEPVLKKIGVELCEAIDHDRLARKKRDEKYAEGLRRTGLGDEAPGGASFEGASKIVHPVMTEACIDFSSRAIKELFPADGPAKGKIVGEPTKERVQRSQKLTDFMNAQLTVQCPEFRAELEQTLTQVPMGGAQYIKGVWNEAANRPDFAFVPIDDTYLPYAATNYYTAERKTHVQRLTRIAYEAKVKAKVYRDITAPAPSFLPDESAAARANNKIEGLSGEPYDEDGLRTVYETCVIYDIEDDDETDGPSPYIVTIDQTSQEVLSIYRNWDEKDEAHEELTWMVEFPFVPWRGAYAIGLPQIIGSLSGAATGALRALLDAALISNSQTMVKLKGAGFGGQSVELQPTQIAELDAGLGVDDIRKLAMPLPYNQPSTVLFQLLGFVVDAAKNAVRTTMDVANETANAPVGTTMARIEQGMVVYNAIHGRLHNSVGRLLGLQYRLNRMYLDTKRIQKQLGEGIIKRSDFDGPMDVVPVSDPNIFSEAQRYAQVQAVAQRSQLVPQLYNLRKVEERILKTLKIPDALDLLAPQTSPVEENAVSENVKAALGKPIVAFPDQDHIAHLQAHLAFMESPAFGKNPLITQQMLPIMVGHIKEHMVLWYAAQVFELANQATGEEDLNELMDQTKSKEDKQALDRMIAQASLSIISEGQEAFAELQPVIAAALDTLQKMSPPMPPDPASQAAMADIDMRKQLGNAKIEADGARAQAADALKAQDLQQRAQTEAQRLQLAAQAQDDKTQLEREKLRLAALDDSQDSDDEAARIAADQAMNTEDNETAITITEMEIGSAEDVAKAQLDHDQNQNQEQNNNQNPNP